MKSTATFISASPSTDPPGVLTVRKWVIPEDGMTTEGSVGSFEEVPLYTLVGGWGAIVQFQLIGLEGENYLKSIQPTNDGWTLAQKWGGWLCDEDKAGVRPYWRRNGVLTFGTMVFGGQKIKVRTDANGEPLVKVDWNKYRNTSTMEAIEFYYLEGIRRGQLSDPSITHATHPWLIQTCTQANKLPVENSYSELTKGTIYHPVWDPRDWPSNNGGELLIAKAFTI